MQHRESQQKAAELSEPTRDTPHCHTTGKGTMHITLAVEGEAARFRSFFSFFDRFFSFFSFFTLLDLLGLAPSAVFPISADKIWLVGVIVHVQTDINV